MKPLAFAIALTSTAALSQTAEDYAALGKEAARSWPGYASLCNLGARIRNVNVPRDGTRNRARPEGSRPKSQSLQRAPLPTLPPMQVFDNLYFLGTPSVSAWLYGTEDGYILIDGLASDEDAQEYIIGGMKTLGLDPAAIKLILVTHGHGDHYGGADYIAATLGIDIAMSAPDWALSQTLGTHPRFGPPPTKGRVVEDEEVLTAGRSQMTLHLTPGHTPGTISPIFPLHDGATTHMAMLWGGTGFNFGPDVAIFKNYAASAQKMRALSKARGIDVILSNHARRDGSAGMMQRLSTREDGAPHPFVKSPEDGYALFDVLENCALAQAARFRAAGTE
jgi:metallo-beta-lactamase class B